MSSVRLAAGAALVGLAALAGSAGAQQVFRIVGPDGKVTFTDRPPQDAKATPAPTVTMPSGGSASPQLPLELRNAASRFPVTLYTSRDCGPCNQARSLLASRGIPFTERTVTSNEDIQALERLMGDSPRVPFATIGGQHVKGFSSAEWSQYLDAAGYPQTSQLPSGYRNPAPAPLVAVQPPQVPSAAAANQPQQAPQQARPALPGPSADNPAGIQF